LVTSLAEKVPAFAGKAAQVRCFNHVSNLTAHSVIRQFDVPKARARATDLELAEGNNAEEEFWANQVDNDITDNNENEEGSGSLDKDDDLGVDGPTWEEERAKLTNAQRKELDDNVRPVRLVLAKVSLRPNFYVIPAYLCPDP
jgi:hypothetical protein